MALPSSGFITMAQLQAETGSGQYNMNWYRNNWGGSSMSWYHGRSWWKSTTAAYGWNSGWLSVPDRGSHYFIVNPPTTSGGGGGGEWGGDPVTYNNGILYLGNQAAWNSFSYVSIPGIGNVGKGSFFWNGSYYQYSIPYNSTQTGTLTFVYAPT